MCAQQSSLFLITHFALEAAQGSKHCPDYTAMIAAQKQLLPPPPFPPFSCTHHNTGKVQGQRVFLPQWLHPSYHPSLPQVWRRKLMFSLLSSPCVQLSSPVAHVDHLPCCTYTDIHVQTLALHSSSLTKPPERRYHMHQEAEEEPLLFLCLTASPPPQLPFLPCAPHSSAPNLQGQHKPGGEAERLLPPLPSAGVPR